MHLASVLEASANFHPCPRVVGLSDGKSTSIVSQLLFSPSIPSFALAANESDPAPENKAVDNTAKIFGFIGLAC